MAAPQKAATLLPKIVRTAGIAAALSVALGAVALASGAFDVRPGAVSPAPLRTPTVALNVRLPAPLLVRAETAAGALPSSSASQSSGAATCMSVEDAYQAIAQATQSEDMTTINSALTEVSRDPAGARGATETALAARLRVALGLGAGAPPCASVLTALSQSTRLAQLAMAAEVNGTQTGAIGQPPPTSPSYSAITDAVPGGARGHGYCVGLGAGCIS